ncbi:hypothetical protein F4778DRAFT_621047 [Xylariomycetidae sp. FL2044]|nr:hypothetical protein F4778DRAFT_621047 [Xylariomycetidae sp. FL2044]
MPVPVVAKAGVIAVSVAVAAAIAVYESPELQRMATDLRRRIAIALHNFGDSISPQERENLFNRPEDAEGFLQSRGLGAGGEPGVDADEETRRRQREELMYWNSLLEEKKGKERRGAEKEKTEDSRPRASTKGSSFDDFLRQDDNAEKGTYVFQTGAQVQNNEGVIRRRGEGARGLDYSVYTNPFSDEHGIDENVAFENSLIEPGRDEIMSDIYSATDLGNDEPSRTATLSPTPPPPVTALVDVNEPVMPQSPHAAPAPSSERELGEDEYMTAGQDDRQDAYSSIQAWAQQTSNPSFYSPLPESPAAPLSEPELISDGALTPTDSASLAGSGEDIGYEAASVRSGSQARYYDVMSDDESIMTPASWTEVGSVVSESEAGAVHAS